MRSRSVVVVWRWVVKSNQLLRRPDRETDTIVVRRAEPR